MSSSPPPSPKHPVVNLTAPPENPLGDSDALRRDRHRVKHRRTPVGIAAPEGSYVAFRSAIVIWSLPRLLDASTEVRKSLWDENTYRSVNSSHTTDGRCGCRCRTPANPCVTKTPIKRSNRPTRLIHLAADPANGVAVDPRSSASWWHSPRHRLLPATRHRRNGRTCW